METCLNWYFHMEMLGLVYVTIVNRKVTMVMSVLNVTHLFKECLCYIQRVKKIMKKIQL